MKRKFLIFLLAVTMVLATAVPGAYAAPRMDPDGLARMTLTLSMPQNVDLAGITELTVHLYKIAASDEFGNYSNMEKFPDLNLNIFDKNTAASVWATNIDAAVAIVKAENSTGEGSGEGTGEGTGEGSGEGTGEGTGEGGSTAGVTPTLTKTLNITGTDAQSWDITFTDVTFEVPGIYLVMVEDAEGTYQKLTFQPMMIALPGNAYRTVQLPGATTQEEAPTTDEWNYSVLAVLKPETERLKGQLKIVKTLDKFATITGTVSFVFQIEGKDAEKKVVYSNVAAISFNSNDNLDLPKFVTLTDIPLGLDYTVTEVYSGGSYKLVLDGYGADDGVVILAADQFTIKSPTDSAKSATASFENDNDNRLIPGNGVVNAFGKDAEGVWQWGGATGGNASAG